MSAIEVSGLCKSFDGRPVLDEVSFSVERGGVFGYLGPNGAGKTTTMRILLGLLEPDAGSARVLDATLGDHDALRGRVGVLLEQNGFSERLTARENLEYYARLYGIEEPRDRIAALITRMGLSGREDDAVGTFSSGMKRKLGIARAILHEPEILFLDEPTSGLDPEAQAMVRELISGLSRAEEMTVFLNSHQLDEVQRICDTVAILHRGSIRVAGPVSELQEGSRRRRFRVTLAPDGDRKRADEILAGLPQVSGTGWEDGACSVTLADPADAPDVLAALITGGVRVAEARRETRSLEEVYLETVHTEAIV